MISIGRLPTILPTIGIGRLLQRYRLTVVYTTGKSSFYYILTIPDPVSDPSLSDHLFCATTFSLTNVWSPKAGFTVIRNAGITIDYLFAISKGKNVRFLYFLY